MTCAILAQEFLHELLHIHILGPSASNSESLSQSMITLVQAFDGRGLYPNGRVLLVVLPQSVEELQHELGLAHPSEPRHGHLGELVMGEEHASKPGKLELTICETGISVKGYNPLAGEGLIVRVLVGVRPSRMHLDLGLQATHRMGWSFAIYCR